MQKDFVPIPAHTEPRLAKIIAMVRGRMILNSLAADIDQELHDWLTGAPIPIPHLRSDSGSAHRD